MALSDRLENLRKRINRLKYVGKVTSVAQSVCIILDEVITVTDTQIME